MKTRLTLYADNGMILTDGVSYGKIVHLAEGEEASKWAEITETEYAVIAKECEYDNINQVEI